MNKNTFNYSKFKKTAFYQDAGELMRRQTRHYMDCYKEKLDSGLTPHEARESCLEQYQDPKKFETKKQTK
jgi:hypothetical protein